MSVTSFLQKYMDLKPGESITERYILKPPKETKEMVDSYHATELFDSFDSLKLSETFRNSLINQLRALLDDHRYEVHEAKKVVETPKPEEYTELLNLIGLPGVICAIVRQTQSKITAIKWHRAFYNAGLKESKDFVEKCMADKNLAINGPTA